MKIYEINCAPMVVGRGKLIYVHGDDESLAEEYGKLYMFNHFCRVEKDYSFSCIAKIESSDLKIGQVIHFEDGDM